MLLTSQMTTTPTLDQLKRAIVISEQIAALEAEMGAIFGASTPAKATATAKAPAAKSDGRKAKKSPETIAKMRAAQQARYAKLRGAKVKAPAKAKAEPKKIEAPVKKKRTMSPAVKAKLAAAMKKRWADAKAGKAPAPTAKKK